MLYHKFYPFLLIIIYILLSNNILSQPVLWISYGPGGGGALYSPCINPHNPQEIFMPTDMSDLFHTTNFGNSWSSVHFKYITAGTMTKVNYTNNPLILYTIDHNEFGNYPKISTDGGISWQLLPNDPTDGAAFFLFADDEDHNKIIVADYTNIFYSSDGGNNFKTIYQGNSGTWGSYIAGIFWDNNDTYICLADGLYTSKNGQTFTHENHTGIAPGEYIVSCSAAKSNGKLRFFAVTNASCYPGMTGAERSDYKSVYSLDYGSGNWIQKNNGLKQTDDIFFTSMAKNNPEVAYLAGEDNLLTGPSVYKTTDGGNSWNNVFNLNNNNNIRTGWSGFNGDRDWSFGEYALGFNVCLNNPDYLIITDLGFSHTSTDGGKTWDQAYLDKNNENPAGNPTPKGKSYRSIGLEQTSCWNITWADKDNLFAGYTDIKGCRSTTGGNTWSFDYNGHGDNTMYYIQKHPSNDNLYSCTSTIHDMYESMFLTDQRIDGGRGKILFSSNKGKDWLTLHDFAHPVIWLAIDPNNPNTMYASVIHSTSGGIYVSNNIDKGIGSTWTILTKPPRTQGHPYNIHILNDGSLVCTYSARMSNDRKTFYPSSGVFYSTDNGTTWSDISDANMQYWTKDLVIDKNDPSQNTWYVSVFSGWGGPANNKGGLYKTINRGKSWNKVFSAARVESCTINPLNQDEMYVSTEYEGLFMTKNLTSPTPIFTNVDSYYFKHPMRIFFNPYQQDEIWVTGFGNGIVKGINTVNNIKITSITLNKQTDTLFEGNTSQLQYSILPLNATNKTVTWKSNSQNIAAVSQSGLVNAIKEGTAQIIVTTVDGNFSDTCFIIVIKPLVVKENLLEEEFTLHPNPAKEFIEITSLFSNNNTFINNPEMIIIYNALGEIVYIHPLWNNKPLFGNGRIRIEVSFLSPGIYFIKIGNRIEKLIKI